MSYQSTSVDTVAVFDSNYNQLFPNARPLKANVKTVVKPMEHPLETGQIISDYKITLPIEIIIPFVVSSQYYRATYAQIANLLATSELLTVQTRASSFTNMFIVEMPEEESPDMFDAIKIELHLKQVLLVQAASNFSPADPTQADTVNSGQQSPSATTLPANSNTNSQAVIAPQINTQQFGNSGY